MRAWLWDKIEGLLGGLFGAIFVWGFLFFILILYPIGEACGELDCIKRVLKNLSISTVIVAVPLALVHRYYLLRLPYLKRSDRAPQVYMAALACVGCVYLVLDPIARSELLADLAGPQSLYGLLKSLAESLSQR